MSKYVILNRENRYPLTSQAIPWWQFKEENTVSTFEEVPKRGKFGSLCAAVTLKISSRSPKANQRFILSHQANLVKICQPVHEICSQAFFGLKFE